MIKKLLTEYLAKPISDCTDNEIYVALLKSVQTLTAEKIPAEVQKRKVYYVSAEFLVGKLLSNNLINLGIYDIVKSILEESGKSLSKIEEIEPEPSLGNGGLGRLAACFLDSAATLNLNPDGIGLNYHYGLFKQKFKANKQTEKPNPWIEDNSWLIPTKFTADIEYKDFTLKAKLFDVLVSGYEGRTNKLHLFDVETVDEKIVTKGIKFDKTAIEKNLTLFLYPDDSDEAGHKLRIYQQYFMVACGAKLILQEACDKGSNLHDLADYAVIQINDTHPSMIIPELIRLLCERGIAFDEAATIVGACCAYTNHTILAEALEKWPLRYFEEIVPQLVPIIKQLDERFKLKFDDEKVAIIDADNRVHMAHMDIHCGFSVNGVAALHSDILKQSELLHFAKIYPEKFNSKTNGITFRRWLLHANPSLCDFIEQRIGEGYKKDAMCLEELLRFDDDESLAELEKIKQQNKANLAKYLAEKEGVKLNPDSIFDIQIKRLHEYKRQQMNVLYIIDKYLKIKNGEVPVRPITFIFGAKAAPSYVIAKDIIHLILCLSELIENDKKVSPHIKIVMCENYNVTLAEKLIPACDVSEQISLASKEASGTGNMKLMLNGAVTLGTVDGANVEIAELVGEDNIYTFGKESDFIIKLYESWCYSSAKIMEHKPHLKMLVDFIISKELMQYGDKTSLKRLHKELVRKDWFMALIDLEEYIEAKEKMFADFENRNEWNKKALANIARAGFFSSDRTIAQYNEDIWKV